MSYDCATYATEEAAFAGALRNWNNYLKEQVPLGKKAKKPDGTIITSLEGLTDAQINDLKLCGVWEGEFVIDNGTTVAFVEPIKAYMIELWYYAKPADKYMLDVQNCVIRPFDPAWEPPIENDQ